MMDRFRPGMVFSEEITLSPELVEKFAEFSGDRNPVHLEADAARQYGFARPFAHGAIQSAVVSKLIGMKVPGSGAVWMSQSMEWFKPVFVGDTIRVEVEIESASAGAEVLTLALRALNQTNDRVMQGSAKVKVAARLAETTPKNVEKETRVALVTGGSRGIGAAVARALGAAGFNVGISYHSKRNAADEVTQSLAAAGVAANAYQADFEKDGSAAALAQRLQQDFGRLDVVVHCATQALGNLGALEATAADYRAFQRIHVETAVDLVRAAAPGMTERKFGRFIFIGTSALFGAPPPKMCAYVTAKQALSGLMRSLSVELGPHQITSNMISPGLTVTDLTSDIPQRIKEAEARRVAVRRLAVPDDIAAAAVFLASDAAGYINGHNLPLTGGPV